MPKTIVNLDPNIRIEDVEAYVRRVPAGVYLCISLTTPQAIVIAAASALPVHALLVLPSEVSLETQVAAASVLQAGTYFYLSSRSLKDVAVAVASALQNDAKLRLSAATNIEVGVAAILAIRSTGGKISVDPDMPKENVKAIVTIAHRTVRAELMATTAAMPHAMPQARAEARPQSGVVFNPASVPVHRDAFFNATIPAASQMDTGASHSQEVVEALLGLVTYRKDFA